MSTECCAAAPGSPIRWSPGLRSATGISRNAGRSFPASAARAMARAATERNVRVDVPHDEATARSLQAAAKELPAIWLYDERGSRLYEEITQLRDYYLPRREAEILHARAASIARRTQARTL